MLPRHLLEALEVQCQQGRRGEDGVLLHRPLRGPGGSPAAPAAHCARQRRPARLLAVRGLLHGGRVHLQDGAASWLAPWRSGGGAPDVPCRRALSCRCRTGRTGAASCRAGFCAIRGVCGVCGGGVHAGGGRRAGSGRCRGPRPLLRSWQEPHSLQERLVDEHLRAAGEAAGRPAALQVLTGRCIIDSRRERFCGLEAAGGACALDGSV